jgi:ankyrin repeat protein
LLDQRDEDGNTPLHLAVQKGRWDIVQYFIEYGKTAIRYIANNGLVGANGLLLEKIGIKVDATNKDGKTAIHLALENFHTDIDKLSKVDIYPKSTPLFEDLKKLINSSSVIRQLKSSKSINLKSIDKHKLDEIKAIIESNPDLLNQTDEDGNTILHLAMEKCYINVVELLIINMTPETINQPNKYGNTALDLAAQKGHENILELLLPIMIPEAIACQKDLLDTICLLNNAEESHETPPLQLQPCNGLSIDLSIEIAGKNKNSKDDSEEDISS